MSYRCCEGVPGLKFSRRYFLKQGGVAMVGLSAMPAFLQRAVAATPMPNKKQLVVLFQRGAADGLNIVVPFGESNYYRMRPTIAIPGAGPPEVRPLLERYRMHRAVRALLRALAARQPLVLVLDDLHWADPASVELVSHLLRHGLPPAMLLATAVRPHQTSRALATVLYIASDAEARREEARAALDGARVECGASAWNGPDC